MSEETSANPAAFSFVEQEHEILDLWKTKQIFQRSLEQTANAEPYIFYDGPPFATGLPHHGHLVGSILKDAVPRYFTMKGRYVQRRFGWDCHGLPIEHEIDKSLGMSSQEAVEKFGVKGYNDECPPSFNDIPRSGKKPLPASDVGLISSTIIKRWTLGLWSLSGGC